MDASAHTQENQWGYEHKHIYKYEYKYKHKYKYKSASAHPQENQWNWRKETHTREIFNPTQCYCWQKLAQRKATEVIILQWN